MVLELNKYEPFSVWFRKKDLRKQMQETQVVGTYFRSSNYSDRIDPYVLLLLLPLTVTVPVSFL